MKQQLNGKQMAHTYFAYITATNLEDLLTSITTARHEGLEAEVEKVQDHYFLEWMRNTVDIYRKLDYVPWRDVKYLAFIEVDIKAIGLEDRERPVVGAATIELKSDSVKPSHITENVYIASVK